MKPLGVVVSVATTESPLPATPESVATPSTLSNRTGTSSDAERGRNPSHRNGYQKSCAPSLTRDFCFSVSPS